MITEVILHYFPDWKPPRDTGREWSSCRCPFHGDTRASAGISYQNDGFNCLGCGFGGGPIEVIRHMKGVTYSEAQRIAEEILSGGNREVPRSVSGESGRRVPGRAGNGRTVRVRGSGKVPARVRSRTAPWA